VNDFLPSAVELIHKLCRDHRKSPDDRAIHLGAYLFAIAALIGKYEGPAALAAIRRRPRGLRSASEVLDYLEKTPPLIDGPTLFQTLGKALQLLEEELTDDRSGRTGLPPETPLVESHGGCQLGGTVVHWIRPSSSWRTERERRRPLADRLPPHPTPHPGDFLHRLAMHWNSDPQQPELARPRVPRGAIPLIEESAPGEAEGFRIALCPLESAWYPLFELSPDSQFFRALGPDSFQDPEGFHTYLETLVQAAVEEEVHLLVLPELMVDRAARKHLVSLMKRRPIRRGKAVPPYGLVAGSFHTWEDGADPKVHEPANRSHLLDSRGETLLTHDKRGKFRLTPHQLKAAARFFPNLPPSLPLEISEIQEGIRHGPTVQVLDTRLGRLALAICADCIAPDLTNLESVLIGLRPDLLLIVSMTDETEKFEGMMGPMAERGIASVFVNARSLWEKPPRNRPVLAAANLALAEPEGAPSTRARWCLGAEEPEVRYYQPTDLAPRADSAEKEEKRDWRPLSQAEKELGETSVRWLKRDGLDLALVIDLGPHWAWSKHGQSDRAPGPWGD